jgi:uncharacterized membrane-anchored protein YitT (DUF2179 family)
MTVNLQKLSDWLKPRETALFFIFFGILALAVVAFFGGAAVIIGMEIAGIDVLNSCDSCCGEVV